MSITINKKTMNFNKVEGTYCLPSLVDKNKLGTSCFWEISVSENKISRKTYQSGGKIREFPYIEAAGKNIGKKNETSSNEQALFQAFGLWTKKQDQGYTIYDPASGPTVDGPAVDGPAVDGPAVDGAVDTPAVFLPMLANKYQDRGIKHLQLPFGVSRKLDGIRVTASFNKRKELGLFSRLGKPFSFLDGIRSSLRLLLQGRSDIIIDGELYSHDLPFNQISGAVRTKKTKTAVDDKIELWIFDLPNMKKPTMRYEDRMRLLKTLENDYNNRGGNQNLRFVYYDLCNKHEDLEGFHQQYVEEGFEGIMCRNLSGPYLFKNRSNDLLKYKAFEDAEFLIVGAKPGVSTEKGAVVFECSCAAGTFDVRPRGSIEKRRQMYMSKDKYIGKQLTVRYQPHTNQADQEADTGIPRFPVGIDVRDYE
jgi:ATP-dependent DNA ligase